MQRTLGEKAGRLRLREWVDRSKFDSDKQAAETLGVHPVVLSQWMTGTRRPDLDNAVLIEQVTGIAVESWLLNEISQSDDESVGVIKRPAKTRR